MVFYDRPAALEALMPGTHTLRWALSSSLSQDHSISKGSLVLKKQDSSGVDAAAATSKPVPASTKVLAARAFATKSIQPLAAAALLQSQSSMPTSLCPRPSTSEQYITGTKHGFRQALRGQWCAVQDRNQQFLEHVKALHEARPNSRGQYSTNIMKKTIPEDAFDDGIKGLSEDWCQKHRGSLIQWVVEAQQLDELQGRNVKAELNASHSEPTLPSAARAKERSSSKPQRPASQQTPKAQTAHRERQTNASKAQMPDVSGKDVTELPPITPLCWGKEAVDRFQKYSDAYVKRRGAQFRRTDHLHYKCQLCLSDHKLESTCAL